VVPDLLIRSRVLATFPGIPLGQPTQCNCIPKAFRALYSLSQTCLSGFISHCSKPPHHISSLLFIQLVIQQIFIDYSPCAGYWTLATEDVMVSKIDTIPILARNHTSEGGEIGN
jgi:hypothetical protein